MIPGVIVGAIGGFAVSRLLLRRRWRRHGYGFGPGACGPGARWGRHGRRGGERMLFWLERELELDREQRVEAEALFLKVKDALGAARGGLAGWRDTLSDAMAGDSFDRTKVEQLASERGQAFAQVKTEIVDALARLHEILTPLQRERLRTLLGRFERAAPHEGPYR